MKPYTILLFAFLQATVATEEPLVNLSLNLTQYKNIGRHLANREITCNPDTCQGCDVCKVFLDISVIDASSRSFNPEIGAVVQHTMYDLLISNNDTIAFEDRDDPDTVFSFQLNSRPTMLTVTISMNGNIRNSVTNQTLGNGVVALMDKFHVDLSELVAFETTSAANATTVRSTGLLSDSQLSFVARLTCDLEKLGSECQNMLLANGSLCEGVVDLNGTHCFIDRNSIEPSGDGDTTSSSDGRFRSATIVLGIIVALLFIAMLIALALLFSRKESTGVPPMNTKRSVVVRPTPTVMPTPRYEKEVEMHEEVRHTQYDDVPSETSSGSYRPESTTGRPRPIRETEM